MNEYRRARTNFALYRRLAVIVTLLAGVLLAGACRTAPNGAPGEAGDSAESPPSFDSSAGVSGAPVRRPEPADGDPAWTVLVYLNGANELQAQALAAVNGLESAEPSEDVQFIVQLARADGDWSGVRRLLVGPDDDRTTVSSLVAEELGPVSMVAPATLADFVEWGVTTFPAQRYALIMGGYGAGWPGMAAGAADDTVRLSLDGIQSALAEGLAAAGGARFDLVALDAGLMAQLDVLRTLAPFADVVVASPDLMPGGGLPYSAVAGEWVADPQRPTGVLAAKLVQVFDEAYAATDTRTPATLSAVRVDQLAAVDGALDELATLLAAEPAFHAHAVGAARHNARTFAAALGPRRDDVAAVDLRHLAVALGDLSPDVRVQAAARQLVLALDQTVIAAGERAGGGVAVYFPATVAQYDGTYSLETRAPRWNEFLVRYHALAVADPQLTLVTAPTGAVSRQSPALVGYELAGRYLASVSLRVTQPGDDGAAQLVATERLAAAPARLTDGSELTRWRDGVHRDVVAWTPEGPYLVGDGGGATVVTWPGAEHVAVTGRFQSADTTLAIPATLLFDPQTGRLLDAWGHARRAFLPLRPAAGDQFTPDRFRAGDDGAVSAEPGPTTLTFDAAGQLTLERRTLPAGEYTVGFVAETVRGTRALAAAPVTVNSDADIPGYAGYLDPAYGYQFLYPETWSRPVYGDFGDTLLFTGDISGTLTLQVKRYADPTAGAESLKQAVLSDWSGLALLYETTTEVGGEPALWTAYGYSGVDGARQGVFLTLAHDGAGYVIDLDAPAAQQAATLATIDMLAASWQFRRAETVAAGGAWPSAADGSALVPTGYSFEALTSGWARWTRQDEARAFIARRAVPGSVRDEAAAAAYWLGVAAGDSADFTVTHSAREDVNGTAWTRNDFAYTTAGGRAIAGTLLVTVTGGEQVVWLEAPDGGRDAVLATALILMAVDAP